MTQTTEKKRFAFGYLYASGPVVLEVAHHVQGGEQVGPAGQEGFDGRFRQYFVIHALRTMHTPIHTHARTHKYTHAHTHARMASI
jgi:hypothetical protein